MCLLLTSSLAHAQLTNGSHSLSLNESLITWKVDFSIGTKGHEGTLRLISGNVLIKEGRLHGGIFVIDMNSVHVTDLKPDDGGKDLEEHLRGTDFLSTDVYPKANFTVLKSETGPAGKINVSGYLVMKGISNAIIIPAVITETKTSIIVKSDLTLNRTLWGINYQSGLFGALKDDAIADDMHINLNLVFKKAQ